LLSGFAPAQTGHLLGVGIRETPVIRHATLPDGSKIEVRVVVPDDPYIPRRELDTVVVELERAGSPVGVVETPLSSDDEDEGLLLAERIRLALESGAVEPTAEGIEQLALTPPV
jgi:hypothetical protein